MLHFGFPQSQNVGNLKLIKNFLQVIFNKIVLKENLLFEYIHTYVYIYIYIYIYIIYIHIGKDKEKTYTIQKKIRRKHTPPRER